MSGTENYKIQTFYHTVSIKINLVLNKKKSINSEPTALVLQHGRKIQVLLDNIEECQFSIMLV
jgi:hypothetical protein